MQTYHRPAERSHTHQSIANELEWLYGHDPYDSYDYDFDYQYDTGEYDISGYSVYCAEDFQERNAKLQSEPPVRLRWEDQGGDAWLCYATCAFCAVEPAVKLPCNKNTLAQTETETLAVLTGSGCPHTQVMEVILALLYLEDPPKLY